MLRRNPDYFAAGHSGSGLLKIIGSASLAGTLDISCFGSCSFPEGTELQILSATAPLTGRFADIIESGFAGTDTGDLGVLGLAARRRPSFLQAGG